MASEIGRLFGKTVTENFPELEIGRGINNGFEICSIRLYPDEEAAENRFCYICIHDRPVAMPAVEFKAQSRASVIIECAGSRARVLHNAG